MLEETIGANLTRTVARFGDREALVECATGRPLDLARVRGAGRRLRRRPPGPGLEPGERVGVWGPNSAEWLVAQFATARVGLIQVNINPAYRLSEVEYTLKKVGVKALVSAHSFKTSDYLGMTEALAPEIASSTPGARSAARLPDLKVVIQMDGETRPGWLAFDAVSALADDIHRARAAEIESAASTATTRSTSSSPAAPPACPRARRCRTATS